MEKKNMKKKHCTYCQKFYQNKISPDWGRHAWIVKGCDACHVCYENGVKHVQDELDTLKRELEDRKVTYEAALSNLVEKSKLELDTQKKVSEFLKVQRGASVKGDVTLRVQGQEISAHRAILASKSQVFRKLFEGETPEDPPKVVELDDATHPVIEALVNFCYTGEISFTEIVPPDEILKSAHVYRIEHLRKVCEAELCGRISSNSVLRLFNVCRPLGASRIQKNSSLDVYVRSFLEFKDKHKSFESLADTTESDDQ